MKWKRWKMGLAVSALTGCLMGVTTLLVDQSISLRGIIILLVVNAAKDVLLFLKEHPVDAIVDDTQQLAKPPTP